MTTTEQNIAITIGKKQAFNEILETIDNELFEIHEQINMITKNGLGENIGAFSILTGQLIETQKIQNIIMMKIKAVK